MSKTEQPEYLTRATGAPIGCPYRSLTAGANGPVLLQDVDLLEKIQSFAREKIPARNVHALGTGAYGTLTMTNDVSKYSCAKVFKKGTKTNLFARMSGIFTEQGDSEAFRDPRGFAIKFYTEEGIWDLLAINTPVFNARDMKVGPDGVHAFKRDPRTGLWNPTQTWDFINNHPESLFQALMIYSDDYGTPSSYRTMNAFGCNTFSMVNDQGERFWVKFHILSETGLKGFDLDESKRISGEDPNALSRDLHNAIEDGSFPRWKFAFQAMPEKDGYEKSYAFDCTKIWSREDYPLIDLGVIELNRNPINYFAEVEQVAFSPANVVPGIGFSPDKLLQGRLMLYDDTQTHRIGPNYKQIPINRPTCPLHTPYYGGSHQQEVIDKFPLYTPSHYKELSSYSRRFELPVKCDGPADYYQLPHEGTDQDYYEQPRLYYNSLTDQQKCNLSRNLADTLEKIPSDVVEKTLNHLFQIDNTLADRVKELLSNNAAGIQRKSDVECMVHKMKVDKIK